MLFFDTTAAAARFKMKKAYKISVLAEKEILIVGEKWKNVFFW